jgi:hypothetical protein
MIAFIECVSTRICSHAHARCASSPQTMEGGVVNVSARAFMAAERQASAPSTSNAHPSQQQPIATQALTVKHCYTRQHNQPQTHINRHT